MTRLKKDIRDISVLALPIIIENILQTLLGTTDTYFAGQLTDNWHSSNGIWSCSIYFGRKLSWRTKIRRCQKIYICELCNVCISSGHDKCSSRSMTYSKVRANKIAEQYFEEFYHYKKP